MSDISISNLNARMDLKWREFSATLAEVQKRNHKSAGSVVLSNSRKLVKKFAWEAPYKTGRLRAGFWPVATALMVPTIYTPYPNKGEGRGVVKLDARNPSVTIVNSVPYVANAGGRGTGWWFKSIIGITERMKREMEQNLKANWRK